MNFLNDNYADLHTTFFQINEGYIYIGVDSKYIYIYINITNSQWNYTEKNKLKFSFIHIQRCWHCFKT